MSLIKYSSGALPPLKHVRGMSLIEVLVAVVVVSIGLLGIAALQVTTLQNNHNSLLRTQASALADDIIDRMRANRNAALAGEYLKVMGTPAAGASRAKLDLISWQNALATILPRAKDGSGADGSVTVDAATGLATVIIGWGERGNSINDPAADQAITFTTTTVI